MKFGSDPKEKEDSMILKEVTLRAEREKELQL